MSKEALLIIDVQAGAFNGELIPGVLDGEDFLSRLKLVLSKFRKTEKPIIYIQDCGTVGGAFEEGSRHWEIHPQISPHQNDIVIKKKKPDAFEGTKLLERLKDLNIKEVIACGLHSESCFSATCKSAIANGFTLTVVSDGHRPKTQSKVEAKAVMATTNENLLSKGAQLIIAADI